jgi:hypothetical protein
LLKKRNQERGCNLLGREYGTPTNKQMELINELAKVELEPEQVFVFPDKLVGDMIIPNRYMQISKQLLNVFKEDANSGVSLLIDHPWAGFGRPKAAIPYGRTFNSKLKKSDVEGEEWALFADHYIVRGKEIDGISTDSIIASIQDGTFFDTSIGWGADKYECSICGNDYRDYRNCEHYAGREYEGEICHVIAKPPGFLMENSIVMDGAYPGAGVLSKNGSTKNTDMVLVDNMKGLSPGVSLFHTFSARKGKLLTFARKEDIGRKIIAQGITLSKGGVKFMDEKTLKLFETLGIEYKEGESKTEDVLKQIAEKWDATVQSIKDSATPTKDEATPYMTQDEVAGKLGKELSADELLKLAKEGDDYLAALKKDAEEWGIRAYGDKYNKDSWNIRFQYANSTELKGFIETFKVEAESAIPAGRQSDPEASAKGKPADNYPDEAFEM